MAKRKIVLLVVEGASDASLLVPAFSSLIENRLFQGQEFHCDVLTAPNHREEFRRRNGFYPADNPAQTVRELVEYYLRDHDRAWGQLGHVIQICDLDGAFTSDDRVREDPLVDGTQYSTTDIITPNRTILIADRTTKRNGVDALLKLDGFRKKNGRATLMVPYRLFYVSRNLEHAFRGRIDNLDAQHKQSSAIKLADRFTRSVISASNLESGRWGDVFGDGDMAAAVIDRIVHHGGILRFHGESYRNEHSLMK